MLHRIRGYCEHDGLVSLCLCFNKFSSRIMRIFNRFFYRPSLPDQPLYIG